MSQYELLIPSATVILRRQTARGPEEMTIRLENEDGTPVSLGRVTLSGDIERRFEAAQQEREHVVEKKDPAQLYFEQMLAAGMPPDVAREMAGLAPSQTDCALGAPLLTEKELVKTGLRVLDAPMQALSVEDFEKTIEQLSAHRDNMEGEIGFLKEIEADEEDIEELFFLLEQTDTQIAAVVSRFTEYKKSFNEIRGIPRV